MPWFTAVHIILRRFLARRLRVAPLELLEFVNYLAPYFPRTITDLLCCYVLAPFRPTALAWIIDAPETSHGLVRIGVGGELLDLRHVHDVDRDHLNFGHGLTHAGDKQKTLINEVQNIPTRKRVNCFFLFFFT